MHCICIGVIIEHSIGQSARLVGKLKIDTSWIDDFGIGRIDGFIKLKTRQVSNEVNDMA